MTTTKPMPRKKEPPKEQRRAILPLNQSLETLAAHLCAYANVLQQCRMKPLPR